MPALHRFVAAPARVRSAKVLELLGQPCACPRCQTEALLPGDLVQALETLYSQTTGIWAHALQEALEARDADALAALQVGCSWRTDRVTWASPECRT